MTRSPFAPLLLTITLVGCSAESPPATADTMAPEAPARVDATCRSEVQIPGPMHSVLERSPDPHANTFGALPEPRRVHLGWPGADTSRSIAFTWVTEVEPGEDVGTLASLVELQGPDDPEPVLHEGASYLLVHPDDAVNDPNLDGAPAYPGSRVHELRLCGALTPSTTYTYRVGGGDHWSPTYTFTTPPEPGSDVPITVAVLGDSRGSYEEWGQILAAANEHDPDVFLFTGDMVEYGTQQWEWDAWFDATGSILAEKVIVPSHGNHEFLAANYFAMFAMPHNGSWFHVDVGPLRAASLNDSFTTAQQMEVEQVDYMDDIFTDDAPPWRFAFHHRATFSANNRHGSAENLRRHWQPAFERGGVQLVFAGHNHIYERSKPILGSAEAEDGVTYIVSGGAGAPLYRSFNEDAWFLETAATEQHYLIGQIQGGASSWEVRSPSGSVLDAFEVNLDR